MNSTFNLKLAGYTVEYVDLRAPLAPGAPHGDSGGHHGHSKGRSDRGGRTCPTSSAAGMNPGLSCAGRPEGRALHCPGQPVRTVEAAQVMATGEVQQ